MNARGRAGVPRGRDLRLRVVAVVALVMAIAAVVDAVDGPETRADSPPVPSAGCETPSATGVGPGQRRVTVASGGQDRWYLREIPPAHDGRNPVPVVVDLHGYGEGAVAHAESTQLAPYGAMQGFITVTPQGQGAQQAWDSAPGSLDVRFVGDLLDQVERTLCVDTDRIFATGSSNGAMLASTLACVDSTRIAAVAAVAGVATVDGCTPRRAVPIVAFHGSDDPVVRYNGGLDPGIAALPLPDGRRTIADVRPEADLSIPQVMGWWADRDSCETDGDEERMSPSTVLLRFRCPGWTAVELYRIDGGGHTWPGRDISSAPAQPRPGPESPLVAADTIWAFLEDHPLSITPAWQTYGPTAPA
jgi:polyhydroxybutyrate depolymerase